MEMDEMNVADEEHPKKEISTATSGAPARSAHRSPEIHGPFSPPRPETLFFVVSSPATSMYHCLARPAPRQEYAAQNALSHYCLGYTPFMKQFEASGR